MKKKAELVYKTSNQRFYKMPIIISKGKFLGQDVDAVKELKDEHFKKEYQYLLDDAKKDKGYTYICISDATTHNERLVFGAVKIKDKDYAKTRTVLSGCLTFMIYGGSLASMRDDKVYIRHLLMLNSVK